MQYEILLPEVAGAPSRIVTVHAENWLEALRRGHSVAGRPAPNRNLAFDLKDDGGVVVTDTETGLTSTVTPAKAASVPRAPSGGARPVAPAFDPFEDDTDALVAPPNHRPNTSAAPTDVAPSSLARDLAGLPTFGADIVAACDYVLSVAMAHIPSDAGSVLLVDPHARSLYFATARGPVAASLTHKRIPLEVGIAGASIRDRVTLNIVEPGADPRFARGFAEAVGYHPKAILCAPILDGTRAFGVVELLDPLENDVAGFSAGAEGTLTSAAQLLGAHLASTLAKSNPAPG